MMVLLFAPHTRTTPSIGLWRCYVVDLGPEPWTFLPGGRPPAPGRLRLVQAFVNTTNLESGQDAIAEPEGLARWADTMGLDPAAFTADDVRRALELREGLRGMLMANAGHGDGHEGAAAFEHAARAAHLTLTVGGGGVELRPQAPGVDGVLGGVLTACHHAPAQRAEQQPGGRRHRRAGGEQSGPSVRRPHDREPERGEIPSYVLQPVKRV